MDAGSANSLNPPHAHEGFAHPQDHVLFGLLAARGLVRPEDFGPLVQRQRRHSPGTTLLEMLSQGTDISKDRRAGLQELLHAVGNAGHPKDSGAHLAAMEALGRAVQAIRLEAEPLPSEKTAVDDAASSSHTAAHHESLTAEELHRVHDARPHDALIGREISGHIILDRIGEGGQGDVYLAKQLSLNRYVAMKKLVIPRDAEPSHFVEAFRREARTLAAISHGRIVKVHEILDANGTVFFTMEHLQGKTLRQLVADNEGPLPLDVVANLACQACSALERTSAEGLVHRDIKPANMIVDQDGDLKIVDFGLAAAESEFLGRAEQVFTGTPTYASPEQFALQPLTPLSDMYSLGATLYLALAGRAPFEARRSEEIRNAHLHTPPPPPSAFNNLLPAAVDHVILRMLAKRPAERFPSFTACFVEWERILMRHSGARSGARQLLGETLVRFAREEKDAIRNTALILALGWLLVTLGAILGEERFRSWQMEWFLKACGDFGTWLIAFSLSCIGYVALVRKKWLPLVWSLRGWLYTHIATAIPAVILLLIHSGNFLTARGSIPPMPPPLLSVVMGAVLLVTAISGTVGLLIFRSLQRRLALQQMQLHGARATDREQMVLTLGARALSGWRLVHYPLAILFVVLAIVHILQSLRFAVG